MPKVIFGFALMLLGFGAMATTGCGDDGQKEIEEECEHHDECLDDGGACLGGECTDIPQEGDSCPDAYEDEKYEDLVCMDGSWQIDEFEPPVESDRLQVATEPPAEVVAGESFEVEIRLVDQFEDPIEMEGVEIDLALNQGEFSDGGDTVSTDTTSTGIAGFELVIEDAGTGYELEATSEHEDFEEASTTTASFDVLATAPVSDHSWISGEDGVTANGEDEAEITIELFDADESPVAGLVPSFEASGEGNDYGDCSETDSDGIAYCTMTTTEPGDKTLEIVDPVSVVGETITFVSAACHEDGEPFGGGEGSAEEPHLICAPEHLAAIGDEGQYLEDYFLVTQDIDLSGVGDFEVIGDSEDDPFSGSFDGQGFVIDNLLIDEPSEENRGFFGHVEEGAVIVDLRLENIEVSGSWNTAGLIGTNDGEVSDIVVTGEVNAQDSTAGGAVGSNTGTGVLTNVAAEVDVESLDRRVGGLVGSNRGQIIDSYATGDVVAPGGEGGGLVGTTSSSGYIMGSYATGDVDLDGDGDYGGGLVGLMEGDISDCYATGKVDAGVEMIGGLIGYQYDGDLVGSYATGDAEGIELVGGLVGYRNDGTVLDSYSTGDAHGVESVGGLVGYHRQGLIANTYATGTASGDDEVGGFIGTNEDGEVEASYWDTALISTISAVGEGDDEGISGLETDEFDDESEFSDAGWDFTDIWTIGEAPDGEQRPILQWQLD